MKQMAPQDRPREKLERSGARALGDNELLALVLGEGTRDRNVLELANELLAEVGSLRGLASASRDQLCRRKGVGCSRAARVVAAVELGRRTMLGQARDMRPQILSPGDAAALLLPQFGAHGTEQFGVALLDTKHRMMRVQVLSTGALDSTSVHPREVFREAVMAGAAAVVLFHNHPSGDPTPSREDLVLTQRLRAAGELMGIEVLDHVILANDTYYSFRAALPRTQAPQGGKRKRTSST